MASGDDRSAVISRLMLYDEPEGEITAMTPPPLPRPSASGATRFPLLSKTRLCPYPETGDRISLAVQPPREPWLSRPPAYPQIVEVHDEPLYSMYSTKTSLLESIVTPLYESEAPPGIAQE